jgi:hypothetical protein
MRYTDRDGSFLAEAALDPQQTRGTDALGESGADL